MLLKFVRGGLWSDADFGSELEEKIKFVVLFEEGSYFVIKTVYLRS